MEPECVFPCLQKPAVKHNANKNLFQICLLLKCWSELDLHVSQKDCSNVYRGFILFVIKNLHKPGMYIFCKKWLSKISYVNSVLHI